MVWVFIAKRVLPSQPHGDNLPVRAAVCCVSRPSYERTTDEELDKVNVANAAWYIILGASLW